MQTFIYLICINMEVSSWAFALQCHATYNNPIIHIQISRKHIKFCFIQIAQRVREPKLFFFNVTNPRWLLSEKLYNGSEVLNASFKRSVEISPSLITLSAPPYEIVKKVSNFPLYFCDGVLTLLQNYKGFQLTHQ